MRLDGKTILNTVISAIAVGFLTLIFTMYNDVSANSSHRVSSTEVLQRIEIKIDALDKRVQGIEQGLIKIKTTQQFLLDDMEELKAHHNK